MLAAKWKTPRLLRNTTHYRPVWACPALRQLAPTGNVPSSHGLPTATQRLSVLTAKVWNLAPHAAVAVTALQICSQCLLPSPCLSYSLCRHPSLFACDGTRAPDHFHAGHGTSQEQKQMLGYQIFCSSKQCIQTGWKDYKDWQV